MLAGAVLLALQVAPDLSGEASRQVARQECKLKEDDEILVCGRRNRDEKYRLPDRNAPFTPEGEMESVLRERERWAEGRDTGIQSCGPVGPAGWTGCLVKQWQKDTQQSQWGSNRPSSGH